MTTINTPYEAGAPLKVWDAGKPEHKIMTEMVLQTGEAVPATGKVLGSEPLFDSDWAALGRANYHAFLAGFEPIFALVGDRPLIDPAVENILKFHSKILYL